MSEDCKNIEAAGWERFSPMDIGSLKVWQIKTPQGERMLLARSGESVALVPDPGFLNGKPKNRWAEMRKQRCR
ncbi:MAG: hypothetical protein PHC51_03945 [bacterium]|nr:hypothetical protein [bacterium]